MSRPAAAVSAESANSTRGATSSWSRVAEVGVGSDDPVLAAGLALLRQAVLAARRS